MAEEETEVTVDEDVPKILLHGLSGM